MTEKLWILIQISLKFVTKDLIDNTSALLQVMAWHQTEDKILKYKLTSAWMDVCLKVMKVLNLCKDVNFGRQIRNLCQQVRLIIENYDSLLITK